MFQVVVLSRIIPDEEQALSSATGIKLLVDLPLQDSQSSQIHSLAADCIARLAHTRAGKKDEDFLCCLIKNLIDANYNQQKCRLACAFTTAYLCFP